MFDSGNSGAWRQTSRNVVMDPSYVHLSHNVVYQLVPLRIYFEEKNNGPHAGDDRL